MILFSPSYARNDALSLVSDLCKCHNVEPIRGIGVNCEIIKLKRYFLSEQYISSLFPQRHGLLYLCRLNTHYKYDYRRK